MQLNVKEKKIVFSQLYMYIIFFTSFLENKNYNKETAMKLKEKKKETI